MGYTVEFYDNVYNVQMIDGDIVEGWFTQTVKFPVGAFSGALSLLQCLQGSSHHSNGKTHVITHVEPKL